MPVLMIFDLLKLTDMKSFFIFVRILLGTVLFVFGVNGFLHFIPLPPTTVASASFQQALWETNYLMHLVKSIEIAGGALLLLNRWVPLALLLLLPVTVNIFLVDVVLQPAFMFMGLLVFGFNLLLLVKNLPYYAVLFEHPVPGVHKNH